MKNSEIKSEIEKILAVLNMDLDEFREKHRDDADHMFMQSYKVGWVRSGLESLLEKVKEEK